MEWIPVISAGVYIFQNIPPPGGGKNKKIGFGEKKWKEERKEKKGKRKKGKKRKKKKGKKGGKRKKMKKKWTKKGKLLISFFFPN